ncbi:MAG: hypothetical protein EXS38_00655 [Opitutus sp.]|nr:hypothetical protein [Opitutus sp.]
MKLLKVAGRVTMSVRRVYIQLSSAYPRPDLFRLCHARLMQLAPADGQLLGPFGQNRCATRAGRRSVGASRRKTPFGRRARCRAAATTKNGATVHLFRFHRGKKSKIVSGMKYAG